MWTPDQTARKSSLVLINTVCHRGFKSIPLDNESQRPVEFGALRVNVNTVTIFLKNGRVCLAQTIH